MNPSIMNGFLAMQIATQFAWPGIEKDRVRHENGIYAKRLTWSNVIAPSLNLIPPSSSSSSSMLLPPFRIAPNDALLPANENGVEATLVPNTLVDCEALNALKSVTTLREGEDGLVDGAGAVDGGVDGRRGKDGAGEM